MRLFISGSAPLLPETFASSRRAPGSAILERYGMTETGMITSNPLDGERRRRHRRLRRCPACRCASCAPTALPAPPGEVGVHRGRGPNVFAGYWRMPEKTREEFTRRRLLPHRRHRRRWTPNGYVRIVGRAKDLIITGGLNVYPKEIEESARRARRRGRIGGDRRAAMPTSARRSAAVVVAKPGHVLDEAA